MTTTEDRKTARAAAPRKPSDDVLVDYLAISVSRLRSGALYVRLSRIDALTRRLVSATLVEGQESRTSDEAMAEWLRGGLDVHDLDLQERLRLW